MTWLDFLVYVIVAAICAAIAGAILGVRAGGFLAACLIGIVGAFLGAWLSRQLGLPELFVLSVGGAAVPVVWTVVGSFLILFVVGLMRRGVRS
jgi:uncharacterized membrane protein YeaQ/YmgE (transglycosylase-associated protein family)